MKKKTKVGNWFERFSSLVIHKVGSTGAFFIALAVVIIWAVLGPLFDFSQTWQLVINTGTTIITFLMVFLIQKTQNKESLAIQLKLNELVATSELASNRLISVEDMTEEELEVLHKFYTKLAEMTKNAMKMHESHSIDEAEELHKKKHQGHKQHRADRVYKKG
jgi:low affinity Fe/Cu permease